jgi:hypothetical protein
MSVLVSFVLNVILIGLLATGIACALRLSRQLAALRASHSEMESFVANFSATVQRAEAGVRGLKQAARNDGDLLEKQIEKAQAMRDELHFLIESADKIANRLSATASSAVTGPQTPATPASVSAKQTPSNPTPGMAATTTAERELMQALKNRG